MLTNEVLAVRLTAGEDVLGVVLNVGDGPADVALPMRVGEVVAGEATVRGGSVRVPPHGFALLAGG